MSAFSEEERTDGLLEVITGEDGPRLERTPTTRLHELGTFDDEGGLWALTPLTAFERAAFRAPVADVKHEDCTVIWRADVDGLHARCTLLSSEGLILEQWEAHGNG